MDEAVCYEEYLKSRSGVRWWLVKTLGQRPQHTHTPLRSSVGSGVALRQGARGVGVSSSSGLSDSEYIPSTFG